MKETEREILLHNIKNLPDSEEGESQDESQSDSNENGSHLFSIVDKSPNPNFLILEKDLLVTNLLTLVFTILVKLELEYDLEQREHELELLEHDFELLEHNFYQ
jgi:hypothetical protein